MNEEPINPTSTESSPSMESSMNAGSIKTVIDRYFDWQDFFISPDGQITGITIERRQ
jgi:hypothetical protein